MLNSLVICFHREIPNFKIFGRILVSIGMFIQDSCHAPGERFMEHVCREDTYASDLHFPPVYVTAYLLVLEGNCVRL